MTIAATRFHALVSSFKRATLFNELDWDRPSLKPQTVVVNGESFTLTQLAHKRGVAVLQCSAYLHGNIPARPLLLKIEREAAKIAHEHLLVFADAAQSALT